MTTTATHLRSIALHWTDLHDAISQPAIVGAFGLGLRGYLARLDTTDPDQTDAALLRAQDRDPMQLGVRPIPVRLHILEVMTAVEADLIDCADTIAHAAQRAPITVPAARKADYRTLREARIAATDRTRQQHLAHADQHDPRRWKYTGRRTAPYAALWLLARIDHAPGPCRRITEQEEQRIGVVAKSAAARIERALDIAAQRRTLSTPCPDCGGPVDVHGGEGRTPVAHCTGCGRIWAESGVIAA